MRLFGWTIGRTTTLQTKSAALATVPTGRGGWYRILEPFAGAFQRNIDLSPESVLSFAAVYACVTLIATDIAKLRVRLVEQDSDGIWQEVTSPAFSPVITKPNHFQNRIQFYEQWMLSKLIHGNTFVLKERDKRDVVVGQYVLDPSRVRPMVAPDGSVFYSLSSDNLAGLESDRTMVPASEIVHDRISPLFHPLCGVSPISACGLAAVQGIRVQAHSENFFANGAQPGGILTTPGVVDEETAKSLQKQWAENYGGDNAGKIAVLGGAFTFQSLGVMSAVDAQLIEQLKLSAELVCTAFKVPGYMVGVGPAPAYNNVEALKIQYYGQCLQAHIESIELLQDEGLGLTKVEGRTLGTEFDRDELIQMDTATRVKAGADAIGSGLTAPNEARKRFADLGPVKGGDSPYLQQQNYSLEALAKRDTGADPFGTSAPKSDTPSKMPAMSPAQDNDAAVKFALALRKAYEFAMPMSIE